MCLRKQTPPLRSPPQGGIWLHEAYLYVGHDGPWGFASILQPAVSGLWLVGNEPAINRIVALALTREHARFSNFAWRNGFRGGFGGRNARDAFEVPSCTACGAIGVPEMLVASGKEWWQGRGRRWWRARGRRRWRARGRRWWRARGRLGWRDGRHVRGRR